LIRRSWPVVLMAISALTVPTASAFQLNMVATHGTQTRLRSRQSAAVAPSRRRTLAPPSLAVGGGGVTSSLISNLAVVALKLRLADQTGVKCDVTGSTTDLLMKGMVGPVTVRGRGWSSQLGLTCRAIDATVHQCYLDMGSVVSRQKLVLTTPAKGDALIALNDADFANFIKHPLMEPPALSSGQAFHFIKEEVSIDTSNGGTVTFFGEYMDQRWKCILRRGGQNGGQGAVVSVVPATSEGSADGHADVSAELSEVISEFFNEMVFKLDGTYLSFQDMMVTSKGGTPSIMLALSITVKKFPSAGLAF